MDNETLQNIRTNKYKNKIVCVESQYKNSFFVLYSSQLEHVGESVTFRFSYGMAINKTTLKKSLLKSDLEYSTSRIKFRLATKEEEDDLKQFLLNAKGIHLYTDKKGNYQTIEFQVGDIIYVAKEKNHYQVEKIDFEKELFELKEVCTIYPSISHKLVRMTTQFSKTIYLSFDKTTVISEDGLETEVPAWASYVTQKWINAQTDIIRDMLMQSPNAKRQIAKMTKKMAMTIYKDKILERQCVIKN